MGMHDVGNWAGPFRFNKIMYSCLYKMGYIIYIEQILQIINTRKTILIGRPIAGQPSVTSPSLAPGPWYIAEA
jgi:hypothetical protein